MHSAWSTTAGASPIISSYIILHSRHTRMRKTMPWLLAASALLLAGAGCNGAVNEQASVGGETPTAAPTAPAAPVTNADAAVNVYLKGAASDQASATDENSDESQLNSADAQLNAYGNAYDANSF